MDINDLIEIGLLKQNFKVEHHKNRMSTIKSRDLARNIKTQLEKMKNEFK